MEAEVLRLSPSLSLPGIAALGLPQTCAQMPPPGPGSSQLPLTDLGLPTASQESQAWKSTGKEHKALPTPPPGQAPRLSGKTCGKDPGSY